ncbi:MAG TPA: hypothetical protein ENJ82_10200, partial [Bacteroidetes bacterium]|nr:hypothetical protein [Bacteroidota bacterium]
MKLYRLLVLITLFPVCVFAQPGLLQEQISLRLENKTLVQALEKLDLQTQYSFSYNASQLPRHKLTFDFENVSLELVLDKLVVKAGLKYEVRKKSIVIFSPLRAKKPFFTINGYVEEQESGERLVGASVYDARSGRGTITNAHGYFSLKLLADSVKLIVSSVGYALQGELMLLRQDRRRIIQLKPNLELATVEINENEEAADLDDMSGVSVVRLPVSEVNRLPALMGEPDIINILGMMPGVQSASDNQGGLYVRG